METQVLAVPLHEPLEPATTAAMHSFNQLELEQRVNVFICAECQMMCARDDMAPGDWEADDICTACDQKSTYRRRR